MEAALRRGLCPWCSSRTPQGCSAWDSLAPSRHGRARASTGQDPGPLLRATAVANGRDYTSHVAIARTAASASGANTLAFRSNARDRADEHRDRHPKLRIGMDHLAYFQAMYAAFNRRDADGVLAMMTNDVDWPNAWKGGRVVGREAVRDYWSAQWAEIDPHVEPLSVTERADGSLAVAVRQVVRSLSGELVSDGQVG